MKQPNTIVYPIPFHRSKVCKDLVAFVLHFAMNAVDGDILNEGLQGSAKVLHTSTGTEEDRTVSDVAQVLRNTETEQSGMSISGRSPHTRLTEGPGTYLTKTSCFSCLCCRRNATRLLNLSSVLQICVTKRRRALKNLDLAYDP